MTALTVVAMLIVALNAFVVVDAIRRSRRRRDSREGLQRVCDWATRSEGR